LPELPEVETVRDGLARHVLGRTVTRAHVFRDYSVRRHEAGPIDFAARLAGRTLATAARRGKYLWLELAEPDGPPAEALLAHLGMSGQFLVRSGVSDDGSPARATPDAAEADRTHLRVRLELDDGSALDFVDQRTFGYLALAELAPTPDGRPGGLGATAPLVPVPVAHVARDLLDPALDRGRVAAAMRRRRTTVKRALLDQTLVSGVGNIYADEALWRARLHGERPTAALTRVQALEVLDAAAEVMGEALAAGGTSFDALYVNVNGASGYFSRSLAAYGQEGRPCARCGAAVVRESFANRSSYSCPVCQPRPRRRRTR